MLSALRLAAAWKHGPNEIRSERARSAWLLLAEQFRAWFSSSSSRAGFPGVLGELIPGRRDRGGPRAQCLDRLLPELSRRKCGAGLENMTSLATVVRDGRQLVVAAREIVAGDLLLIEAGDIVAADARILECSCK